MLLSIQVIATETDSVEKYSANQTIVVNITNINDHEPVFNESQYTFTVSEGASVGFVLGQIMVSGSLMVLVIMMPLVTLSYLWAIFSFEI